MNREFLDLYNRELNLLHEQASEFAEEYPGIAGRLGGLLRERMDPMVSGLLEGTAFLAARVQLKLKHEFPEFTSNLLEQLVPHYLAPTPSAMLARITPNYGDPSLRDGKTIGRGAMLEATYVDADRRVACRYQLRQPVRLLPFELIGAEYIASPGPLQALGVPVPTGLPAGLRLTLTHRSAAKAEQEITDEQARARPETWFAGCNCDELRFNLVGAEADADLLYEQVIGHAREVYIRRLDEFGDPVVTRLSHEQIGQIGFDEADSLLPNDDRIFRGFDLVREYFLFPRKFLGFRLSGLKRVLAQLKVKTIEIIIVFDQTVQRLAGATNKDVFALYAGAAVNLFEMTTDRLPVRSNQHEYHVVPDRSRMLEFEPHRIVEVFAHYVGRSEKVRVPALYSAPQGGRETGTGLFYTLRRLPRLRTSQEKKFGRASNYVGTDMYLSLTESAGIEGEILDELSVRALCSNRHLTENIPVGTGRSDFRLVDDTALTVTCAAGPTPPREPIVSHRRTHGETTPTGDVTWRLINMLSLNHLGLVERGAGRNAAALREVLGMFADLADNATETKLRGIRSVESRPVVRRLRQSNGVGAARGLEITVTCDDKAFEGSGLFLLGAVLDLFFCEYAAFNSFTQTVIRTVERGEVMRWPARIGQRRQL